MDEQEDIYQFAFSTGWLGRSRYEQLLADPLTPELAPIATAFKANMMRNRNLSALVPEIANWTRLTVKLSDVARHRLGRPIEMPGPFRVTTPLDQELNDEASKVHQEWAAARPKDIDVDSSQAWASGNEIVKMFANTFPNYLGDGIETLLSAMLLDLWASVEALLEDTWVTAVNLAPNPLASNILGNEKTFPVQALKTASFDVSKIMGTLLLRHNKADMNSISGIKSAYVTAFSDQNPDDIFQAYDPDISHLEAIRNLFAHRSGIIDQKFMDRAKNSTIIRDLVVGERLKLNGKIVSFYTGKCVDFAANIFVFVDRWLYARTP